MRLAATLALLVALPACTAGGEGATSASLASTGSFGVVRIERPGSAELPELSARRAVINAVFARYRGIEGQDALALLGVGREGPETDSCALVAGGGVYPDQDAQVSLLDVGPLDVRVAGDHLRLTARTFPELGSLVSGVFYAEDAALPQVRADVDEYRVVAGGGDRVAPFEVVGVAPAAPGGLVIGGFGADESPQVSRDRSLEVVWEAGDPHDRVELQLAAGTQVLECAARDDGVLRVPADLMGQLDADPEARLLLRRVRVQPFDAPGIDVAWADLVSTRTIDVRVR